MIKKLDFLKKIICLFLCFFILFNFVIDVYAKDDYEYYPTSSEGDEEIAKLYEMTIDDIQDTLKSTDAVISWLNNPKTFIIGKVENGKILNTYINVPTIQQWIRQFAIQRIADGWDNEMYTPSAGILKVNNIGKSDSNVMTKFGYDLPTPTYKGEYPKVNMSVSKIVPSNVLVAAWRYVKSKVFGYPFLSAPDKDNFKTIYYTNVTYYDAEQERIIRFVTRNWNRFQYYLLDSNIYDKYFRNPKDVLEKRVTVEQGTAAKEYVKANEEKYTKLAKKHEKRLEWEKNCTSERAYYNYSSKYKSAYDEWYYWTWTKPDSWTAEEIYHEVNPYKTIRIVVYYDADGNRVWPPSRPAKPDWETYRDKYHPESSYPKLTDEEKEFMEKFKDMLNIWTKWNTFIAIMKSPISWTGGNRYPNNVLYNQCLLNKHYDEKKSPAGYDDLSKNDIGISRAGSGEYEVTYPGNDSSGTATELKSSDSQDKCEKMYNGTKIVGDLLTFYFDSGVYDIVGYNYSKNNPDKPISRENALKIVSKLQTKLGPAYSEIMSNWIHVIETIAKKKGDYDKLYPPEDEFYEPRLMPYDKDTLYIDVDVENIEIQDPRVEMYKTYMLGSIVTSGSYDLTNLFRTSSIGNILLSIESFLSQLCVKITEFTTLDFFLKSDVLSPAFFWKKVPATTFVIIILLFLIISIVKSVINYVLKGTDGIGEIITKCGLYLCVIAIITMFTVNANTTIDLISSAFNKSLTFVEMQSLEAKGEIEELLGDKKDGSVVYYIPYFNSWTSYMTGHDLLSDSQQIDKTDSTPEVYQIILPKINNKETKLWSVALVDSFNSKGKNGYVVDAQNNITYSSYTTTENGNYVNRNAYRALDHFLAPRVSTKVNSNKTISIKTLENVNYNAKFQEFDLLTMAGTTLFYVNILFVLILKACALLYFWWMLYMFVFNILLAVAHKGTGEVKTIFTKTFAQIVIILGWGLYSALLLDICLYVTGFASVLLNGIMIFVTIALLLFWYKSRYFSPVAKPFAMLFSRHAREEYNRKTTEQLSRNIFEKYGVWDEENDIPDFDNIFDNDGKPAPGIMRTDDGDRIIKAADEWLRTRFKDNPDNIHDISYNAFRHCERQGFFDRNSLVNFYQSRSEFVRAYNKELWDSDNEQFYSDKDNDSVIPNVDTQTDTNEENGE